MRARAPAPVTAKPSLYPQPQNDSRVVVTLRYELTITITIKGRTITLRSTCDLAGLLSVVTATALVPVFLTRGRPNHLPLPSGTACMRRQGLLAKDLREGGHPSSGPRDVETKPQSTDQ